MWRRIVWASAACLIADTRFDLGVLLTCRSLLPSKLFGSVSRRCHARLSPALCLDADAEALAPPHSFRTDRPDAEGSAAATCAVFHAPALHPLRRVLERVCCTELELILRPRPDRASNDASISPHRSPTPTLHARRSLTGHHIVRAVLLCGHASISPARLDLMTIASSLAAHGVCCPISAARPRILRAVLRIAWARRRCTIIASLPLNDEPQCLVSPCATSVRLRQLQSGLSLAYARVLPHLPPHLPEHVPSHPYAITISFGLATYSAVLTSSIHVL
ncbi:hypothetical protein B0H13DRAFT_2690021 [Mycena leptocephala]|nr:hypothetical protein B0H13DRAFT_2690021 [Mycena leptocephala]